MEKSTQDILGSRGIKFLIYGSLAVVSGYGLSLLGEKLLHKKDAKEVEEEHIEDMEASTQLHRKDSRTKTQAIKDYKKKLRELQEGESLNTLLDEIKFMESPTCLIQKIPHLSAISGEFPTIVSPLLGDSKFRSVFGGEGFMPEMAFIEKNSFVLSSATFGPTEKIENAKRFLRAGPRKNLYFDSKEVKACIVTCGGLCPGLNVVIRELVRTLMINYHVKEVYGIKYGYKGFYDYEWENLTVESVNSIHKLGGTILGSSRGGFDLNKIMDKLIEKGINQVFAIGGDGTHRGIYVLFEEIQRRKLKIAIVGIPKTIDNDIPIIDKSFGFDTSVEEAQRAIASGDVEANAAEYGVGLVKLMGRYAGFIAMYASLAARDVNICLIPEFPFDLEGPRGVLEFVLDRVRKKRHCIIVVAEGATSAIRDAKVGGESKDASGNVIYGDVGVFLKDKIASYAKKHGVDVTLKYIDPTYMIRSVPANAFDREICSALAQNAVHGAMAGFTGFTLGSINNRGAMIPISEITKASRRVEPSDRSWQRLIAATGQPAFLNDEETVAERAMSGHN